MSNKSDAGNSDVGGSPSDAFLIKDPERFAINLARMVEQAGKAAAAWVEPREKGVSSGPAAEPVADMVKTFSKLGQYWFSDPSRALEAQTRLFSGYVDVWAHALQRVSDAEPSSRPAQGDMVGDKRFQDPEWSRNPFFEFLKQAYLAASDWAGDLVEHAEGLDEHTRHKAEFYVRQVTTAMSPSNFLITNPELFRETVASNGENLVRGMTMFAEDMAAGKGELRLRQADLSKFEVGANLALSPGKVVARSELAEILQYAPATETVLKRPLLICPPWINKFYILDLNPRKSFIRWAVEQGHTVFVISWVNPDDRHAKKDWEAYIREGLKLALDTIGEETGEQEVNAVGYCVGGTLLSAALAQMAQDGDRRIASATLFATQVDFTHAGDLKVFVDEDQVVAVEKAMSETGFLEGSRMATAFNMLRSGDLIWPYVVNNYVRGRGPAPFDLLYWNSDSTRMAAANHSFYLRNCYLENRLTQGSMELGGRRISLSDVTIPIYNLAAKEDHIAPAKSVFVGSCFFGGEVDYVLTGSGHIAGVVNPPAAEKYQYWTGPKPAGEFDAWFAQAAEHKGSWWPHWQRWILDRDAARVAARVPDTRGSELGDAPGEYVRARA